MILSNSMHLQAKPVNSREVNFEGKGKRTAAGTAAVGTTAALLIGGCGVPADLSRANQEANQRIAYEVGQNEANVAAVIERRCGDTNFEYKNSEVKVNSQNMSRPTYDACVKAARQIDGTAEKNFTVRADARTDEISEAIRERAGQAPGRSPEYSAPSIATYDRESGMFKIKYNASPMSTNDDRNLGTFDPRTGDITVRDSAEGFGSDVEEFYLPPEEIEAFCDDNPDFPECAQ